MQWIYRNASLSNTEIELARSLAQKCGTDQYFILALLNRGLKKEDIELLLTNPQKILDGLPHLPFTLLATLLIKKHIKEGSSIAVFADYDCDGVTAGYVMVKGLKDIISNLNNNKSKVIGYWPERQEGYGLNKSFCQKCINNNIKLVITVDNGISQEEEVKILRDAGIDVIITDHHPLPANRKIPNANCIIDPAVDCPSRSHLAGVAVAYNLIKVLNDNIAKKYRIDHESFLDAVAVGTISDVMPLTVENLAYIMIGLKLINNKKCNPIFNQYTKYEKLLARDIAWNIAPTINASSRIDTIWTAVAAFFNQDKCSELVARLNKTNEERKKITNKTVDDLKTKLKDYSDKFIVAEINNAPHGIIGLIAGKLTDIFPTCPCFAYHVDENGICKGSIRYNENNGIVKLKPFLTNALEHKVINSFAGHETACVMEIHKDNIPLFINAFNKLHTSVEEDRKLNGYIDNKQDDVLYVDVMGGLNIINQKNMETFGMMPYEKNNEPVFGIKDLLVTKSRQTASGGGFLTVSDNTSAGKEIFLLAPMYIRWKELGEPNVIDIAGNMDKNFMKKGNKAMLRVLDIKASREE